jgi:hypothetical protein
MDLQKLKIKIEKLSKLELIEVFKIIYNNNDKYTSNVNGIFIDLNLCCDKTINEIRFFLNFIDENRIKLYELEDQLTKNKLIISNNNKIPTKIVCNEFSPFISQDDNLCFNEIIEDFDIEYTGDNIDDNKSIKSLASDDIDCDDDETIIDNKKKNAGLKSRLMKKCKNINNLQDMDEIDREDYLLNNEELFVEPEYF